MKNIIKNKRLVGRCWCAALAIAAGATFLSGRSGSAQAEAAAAAPAAVPVSVAVVAPRRPCRGTSSPAGSKRSSASTCARASPARCRRSTFREGALVKQGDLLITIDPAPYAAEVARAEGQVAAAKARLILTKSELERGQQLTDRARSRSANSTSASTPSARPKPTCGRPRRRCRPRSSTSATRRCARRSPAASASSRSPSAIWSPPAPARRC